MIKEYVYMEPLKKVFNRTCDGDCAGLVNSGFVIRIYINKARDLKETKYYCRTCARKLYPRYFNKESNE